MLLHYRMLAGQKKRHSDPRSDSPIKKPEETPAYVARCSHMDGNIIITADYLGGIKVFRQDCAFHKRRQDNWETGSLFSKKMLGRSNSIITRNSGGSHSRRNSVSRNSLVGGLTMPSDHILSWRNNVSVDGGLQNGGRSSRPDRSLSPGKFNRSGSQNPSNTNSTNNLANTARQQPYNGIHNGIPLPATSSVSTTSSPPSVHKGPISNVISQPPTPSFSINSASDDKPTEIRRHRQELSILEYGIVEIPQWERSLQSIELETTVREGGGATSVNSAATRSQEKMKTLAMEKPCRAKNAEEKISTRGEWRGMGRNSAVQNAGRWLDKYVY